MTFEYDETKSKINLEKHGISLKAAIQLWSVEAVEIPARCIGEHRFMRIGKLGDKFYSCIFTVRGEAIRPISARRSRKDEEVIYDEKIEQNHQG